MANANPRLLSRRRLVKSGLALASARFAGPFVISTRAAEAVRIGLDNPLTGPLASLGKNSWNLIWWGARREEVANCSSLRRKSSRFWST